MKKTGKRLKASCLPVLFVIPLGLEPKTYCLEGSCSIQLSYGTNLLVISRKSAAKVGIFLELYKFQTVNLT